MRFAVQSIVWGRDVDEIGTMLSAIRSAGYGGVELFQDIAEERFGGAAAIFQQFQRNDLTLVGIASGSILERVDFVQDYCALLGCATDEAAAPYIYVDEWDERCESALKKNIRIGLHPHMFRPVQTMAEANKILDDYDSEKYPHLNLIPDTAHLTIAGDAPEAVVEKHLSRIRAIHIKDWIPNVGRSYQFYASGFCHLGEGSVPVGPVLDFLWKRRFRGWVVVEHDRSPEPEQSITQSMVWLKSRLPPSLFEQAAKPPIRQENG